MDRHLRSTATGLTAEYRRRKREKGYCIEQVYNGIAEVFTIDKYTSPGWHHYLPQQKNGGKHAACRQNNLMPETHPGSH